MRGQEEPCQLSPGRGGHAAKALPHGKETSFAKVSSHHFFSLRDPWRVAELQSGD